jgi:hypothetical protein
MPAHTSKFKIDFLDDSSIVTIHNTANMPAEVSDIKQFIEICRRKDALCTFSIPPTTILEEIGRVGDQEEFGLIVEYSCAHKEEQEDQQDQVQGPMQASPLHPRPQGLGPR